MALVWSERSGRTAPCLHPNFWTKVGILYWDKNENFGHLLKMMPIEITIFLGRKLRLWTLSKSDNLFFQRSLYFVTKKNLVH